MLFNRKSRRAGQVRPARVGFGATVEVFEKRELLTGVGAAIQGTVFVDADNSNTLTSSDPTLSGVKILLYQGATPNLATATPVGYSTSDANGNYVFPSNGQNSSSGVSPALMPDGVYTVVETTPANYTSSAAQAFSQVSPAKVIATNEIQVTTVSSSETATFDNGTYYTPTTPSNPNSNIDGVDFAINGVQQGQLFATQLIFNTSGDSNDLTTSFTTFCVDPTDALGGPPASFAVSLDPTSGLTVNGGRIGYLFNQYGGTTLPTTLPSGVSGLPTADIEAGLQVAIWELEYPSSGPNSGFVLNGYDQGRMTAANYANVQTAAAAFIADSTNKSEQVGILDASTTGSVPSPAVPNSGGQSVLYGNSLNFGNTPSIQQTATIQGYDYLVPSTTSASSLTTSTTGTPIAGTTVTLLNSSGTAVGTATTSNTGYYSFPNIPIGTYSVVETAPTAVYGHLGQTSTTTGAVVSAVTTSPKISSIALSANGSSTDNFFEYGSTISGVVYADNNANDTLDTGDTGIGGVTVYLYTNNGSTQLGSTTTATMASASGPVGSYSFNNLNLPAGSYTVSDQTPAGYTAEIPNPGTSGGTGSVNTGYNAISSIALGAGVTATSNNFGQYKLASISGTVYADNNVNDTLDTGDTKIGGVQVFLYNSTGTTKLATTTTASDGTYSFNGLVPGTYMVTELPPSGYTSETPNPGISGGTPTYNSSSTLAQIGAIVLNSGVSDTGNNFGQYQLASISGTVYADANANDTLDTGDTKIGGVQVFLYNSTGTTRLATTTTDSTGAYSFGNLLPGTYIVAEFPPSGYSGENPNPGISGGTPTYNSSTTLAQIGAIVLNSGVSDTGNNFGQLGLSSISGTVYNDLSGQGLTTSNLTPANSGDTVESGVTVTLTNSQGMVLATTTTGANGTYSFTGLPYGTYGVAESVPTGYSQTGPNALTYSITTSAAAPNSTNDNFSNYMSSCASGSMQGLTGIYYTVTTPAGVTTKVTTLTGNTGEGDTVTAYFTVPANAQSMQYSLVAYEAPAPYYTAQNVSQQVITSVATGSFGPGAHSLTVTEPNSYYQIDFVCGAPLTQLEANGARTDYNYENRLISYDNGGSHTYAPSSLSGLVYIDANGNGSYNTGDTGLANITVTLNGTTYVGATLNGTSLSPVAVTATTTTNASGAYSFSGLAPGTYTITETHPAGYTDETANTGSVGGTSAVGSVSTIALNSNTSGTNYNFGEILPGTGSISGIKYLDSTGNGLSSTEGPLSGDTPAAGVTIVLVNATTKAQVATTVTSSTGAYSFNNLPFGTYYVSEVVPSGEIQTGPTVTTGPTCTAAIADSGFEGVSEGSGWYSYVYNPSGDAWTFSGQSGLTGNGSAFTAGNSSAPSGNQVCFVQNQGSISQVVSNWTAGSYQLSFSAAQRQNWGGHNEDFQILVDGVVEGTFDPSSCNYTACATPSFYVGSGSHTVTIQGLDSCGGDNTIFLDKLCLVQNTGQVVMQSNNQAYYSVSLTASSPTSTNDNFANYVQCNTSAISNISYTVTSTTSNWWGGTTTSSKTYNTLSGNTNSGNTVSATFTVTGSTNQMVSLVSYVVPYSNAPLSSQVEYSLGTGTFTPGTHTVSITLPSGAYQVDFVCGAAISQFGPTTSNVNYHSENRFFSSDNDGSGTTCYTTPPLANVQSDIGSVGTPGTLSYNNGSYTLTASGADFWGTADAGNYVYQTLDGNGEIVARVDSISNTNSWTKAGLMIRQSLDPGSPQASVFATAGNGVVFQDRETQGAQSNNWAASNSYGSNSTTPVFLKLVREGTTLSAYDSSNGVSWTLVGSDTISMSQSVYIGLAATSHNNSAVATATFDDVSTTGYWASSCGQSLIQSFGGSSNSTCLSSWLAQNYSNLYGSGAGCNNLWGQSNSGVAAFCQSLECQYGAESLECQTLATAIDEYATNWNLGGSYACSAGFNPNNCLSSQWTNTAGSCSAFGTSSSNSWATFGNLLSFENSQASCGTLYAGNTGSHQLACNVIYQVACCW